jgi:tRNA U34 5-carboxymethylaminomethyl modifying GTPase MnmE/TrmE
MRASRAGAASADAALLRELLPACRVVVVHNKSDLAGAPARSSRRDGEDAAWISAVDRASGLPALESQVLAVAASTRRRGRFIAREAALSRRARGRAPSRGAADTCRVAAASSSFAEELGSRSAPVGDTPASSRGQTICSG